MNAIRCRFGERLWWRRVGYAVWIPWTSVGPRHKRCHVLLFEKAGDGISTLNIEQVDQQFFQHTYPGLKSSEDLVCIVVDPDWVLEELWCLHICYRQIRWTDSFSRAT